MKRLTKLMALILTFAIAAMCFVGCGLVKDVKEIEELQQKKEHEAKMNEQMESVVLKIADNIEVNGAYYGWFYSNAYNTAYDVAQKALEADSSAASDAKPNVDVAIVKEEAQKQIVDVKMAYNKALEAGITLTKEDKENIDNIVNNLKSQASQIGLTYNDFFVNVLYTNVETVEQIMKEEYMGNLYIASLVADEYISAKHILVKFGGEGERTKEEALALANEIKASLDAGEDFDKLMNEKSEDGRDEAGNLQTPNGYTFTNGDMVPSFEEEAFKLSKGEISEPVLAETVEYNGYHIIKKVDTTLYGVWETISNPANPEAYAMVSAEREAIAKDVKVEATDKINFYTEQ